MEWIFVLVGIGFGGLVGWLLAKQSFGSKQSAYVSKMEMVRERMQQMEKEFVVLKKHLEDKEAVVLSLSKEHAVLVNKLESTDKSAHELKEEKNKLQSQLELQTDTIQGLRQQQVRLQEANKFLEERLATQKEDLLGLKDKLYKDFELLSQNILEKKTEKFTEQNKVSMDAILSPLKEKISSFEKQVQDAYEKENAARFSLGEKVKELMDLNHQLKQEAHSLVNALKGQSKTQGDWGEMILESILEKSGLVNGREYHTQSSFKSEDGRQQRPDVIVDYPGGRQVVIDAKVSLNAYERFSSAETEEEQVGAMKEHIMAIRNHVKTLSEKNYQDLYQLTTLDYVLMFVPIEPAFLVAVQQDQDLWQYAYERKVVLISPTNLMAVMRLIADMWQVEHQNQNALEIAKRGGELYDKFVGFVEDLKKVGEQVDRTQKSYDAAMNKLSDGKGNLMRQAEMLKELGAKTKKSLS